MPNHCQIIVFMLLTRAEGNSFFQPYYDVLPSDFNNFPIFWYVCVCVCQFAGDAFWWGVCA